MQDYHTKLRVSGATRAESGTYTIYAENCNGKDSADVEVIVLGKFHFVFMLKIYCIDNYIYNYIVI